MKPIRIGIVGVGKITRDQHLPALAANPSFELAAVASRNGSLEGVPSFAHIGAMLAAVPDLDAVAICTPPQVRHDIARQALQAGLHVLLEKPPGSTLGEVLQLVDVANEQGVALFATWHSREAAAVEPARAWLAGRMVRKVSVTWKEDVRVWHPGQAWTWEPGGLGVFDPGINALSILTAILPGQLVLKKALLSYPANRAAPIAAQLQLAGPGDAPIAMDLDWRQTGPQSWDIDVLTDTGRLQLSSGGAVLHIDGAGVIEARDGEYPALYARFAALVRRNEIDVDLAPLRIVADAFLSGSRVNVEPFIE